MTTITTSRLRIERFISGDLSLDDLEDADREDLADDYVPLRLTIGEDIVELAWPDGTECQRGQIGKCGTCGSQWCGFGWDYINRSVDLAGDLDCLLDIMDGALKKRVAAIRTTLEDDLDVLAENIYDNGLSPCWIALVAGRDVSPEAIAAVPEYLRRKYDLTDPRCLDDLLTERCWETGMTHGSDSIPGVYLDGTRLIAWAYDPADPSETIAVIREQVVS